MELTTHPHALKAVPKHLSKQIKGTTIDSQKDKKKRKMFQLSETNA
jgi:hypothetical protein